MYNNGYEILEEDLCFDEGIYYELFRVRKNSKENMKLDPIYYEFSPVLLKDKHPLMIGYLKEKEEKNNRIVSFIKEDSESAIRRKKEVQDKLNEIKRFIEEVK